jgi:hypothetical protein
MVDRPRSAAPSTKRRFRVDSLHQLVHLTPARNSAPPIFNRTFGSVATGPPITAAKTGGLWFFSAFTLTTFFAADVDTDTLAEVPSDTTAPLAFSCVQAYGAQGPKLRALSSSSVTSVSRSCANR